MGAVTTVTTGPVWFKLKYKRMAALRVLTKPLLCTLAALSMLAVLLKLCEINLNSPLGCALDTGTRQNCDFKSQTYASIFLTKCF